MFSSLPGAVPEIPVAELSPALLYYRDKLGFNVDWIGDKVGLAGISQGGCRLFLADQHYRQETGSVGPAFTWLNLDSKEAVDELHQIWAAQSAQVISPPQSQPWGLHEFIVSNPDGNHLRVFYDFSTPLRAPE